MEPNGRSPRRWLLRARNVLLAVLLVFVVLYVWPDSRIVVSPETTYLTEPLDEEGYVDYVEAINRRGSKGVTPENNAAVLYWQALGPGFILDEHREEFFGRLGMDLLPEEGDYFEPLYAYQGRLDGETDYATRRKLSEKQRKAVSHRREQRDDRRNAFEYTPWVTDDDPLAARWLDEQQKSIGLFVAGTRRPRHYVPALAVSNEDEYGVGPVFDLIPYGREYRGTARALLIRSMHNLANGRKEKAWRDCMACFRIVNHIGNENRAVSTLVSYSVAEMAAQAVPTILHEGDFTADQLQVMRAEFRKAVGCASMIQVVDWGERLMAIDTIQHEARSRRGLRGGVDWNDVLRHFNLWHDEVVVAMKREAAGEPGASVDSVQSDRWVNIEEDQTLRFAAGLFSRQARTQLIKNRMGVYLGPTTLTFTKAERRCTARIRRLEVVFALSLYRTDLGNYPTSLAALVPTYLDQIPLDPMDGQPTRYRPQGDGYVLWSVGHNGIDDGGRDLNDVDDVFRVPRRLTPLTEFVEKSSDEDADNAD